MTRLFITLASLAFLGGLLPGCASARAMKCYPGPLRPADEIAVVRGHGTICLVGVDQIEWDGFGKTVEVTPGIHSFIFESRNARGTGGDRATLRRITKAGHIYQTSCEIAKTGHPVLGRYTVRIQLEDITEKAALDPVKRVVRRK